MWLSRQHPSQQDHGSFYASDATLSFTTSREEPVNYTYASRSKCLSPGTTKIYANPDLGALRSTKVLGTC